MVSFAFTDEHEEFRKTLATFSDRVLLPGYRDRAASTDFPFDILKRIGDLGLLGIGLPEQYGGTGTEDPVLLGIATETLAYGDVNMASAPVQIGLVASQLALCRDEIQERYLPPLINGEQTIAIALTEPGSGSDASTLTTTATAVEGGWRLNGEKTAISWAMNATAALVYAREPGSSRARGVSCFVVPLDADGVSVSHMPGMGCLPWVGKHSSVRRLRSRVASRRRTRQGLSLGHGPLRLQSCGSRTDVPRRRETESGGSRRVRAATGDVRAAALRAPGTRVPIRRARHLFRRRSLDLLPGAVLRETAQPHTALASMSKWWPPVVAKNAIEFAMRVHGNLGYSTESPLQQRYRDVTAYLVADGTAEIQKRIIAKDIFARGTVSL